MNRVMFAIKLLLFRVNESVFKFSQYVLVPLKPRVKSILHC